MTNLVDELINLLDLVHIPAQFDHPFWFYLITRSELT